MTLPQESMYPTAGPLNTMPPEQMPVTVAMGRSEPESAVPVAVSLDQVRICLKKHPFVALGTPFDSVPHWESLILP